MEAKGRMFNSEVIVKDIGTRVRSRRWTHAARTPEPAIVTIGILTGH